MLAFCLTARGHDRIETNETGTPLGTFNQSTGGFDTAPMGGLDSARVRTEFSIPEDAEVVALLAIGRTREPDKADPWRFSLERIAFSERFGDAWQGRNRERRP
jgi:hypothetical protein